MTGTLLVFVEDPGAANAVVGLPARLEARGVHVRIVVAGAAAAFVAARGQACEALEEGGTAASLLARTKPQAVFVGTAENPDTVGLAIIDEARRLGLPSASFVDAVSCAEHRFRGRAKDPLAHCPDHVLVCDAETEAAFVTLGVPPERVQVAGHPQFDAILARAAELATENLGALRRRVLPAGLLGSGQERARRVIVFCGERSTGGFDDAAFDAQFRRSADYTLYGRGTRATRTEIVAEELLDAVNALPERPILVLRFHPKNVPADFGALFDEFDAVSAGGSALDLLYASDLVVGMSSMVLLEASLLGRPTLSIVARPLEREWLPAVARVATPCVETRRALRQFVDAWWQSPVSRDKPSTLAHAGAMDRLAFFLARLVRGPATVTERGSLYGGPGER